MRSVFLVALVIIFSSGLSITINKSFKHLTKAATSLFIALSVPCQITLADVQINGLKNGRLLPCRAQSNCVSTSSSKLFKFVSF